MDIRIERTKTPAQKPAYDAALGFGKVFTDHMFLMDHTREKGWHDARIVPLAPLPLHPAATVLHYGTEIFEGLKAYKWRDGSVRLFRPDRNIARMNNSADRLCLPRLDEDFALAALKTFVDLERDWTPDKPGNSLYLRPFMFGNDPFLGLHTIDRSMYCVIASPSGSYYKEGVKPVRIMIENEDVRAVRGGTGYAKCGGNYAASTRAAARAEELGYTQVLWLDGVERRFVEEVGAMNVMFKIAGKVVTPALLGSVLPGVTRMSCIDLLKSWGYEVEERQLSVDELFAAADSGALEEAWGCGTAAVISPIGSLTYLGKEHMVNGGQTGSVTQRLYDGLTGIQQGVLPDTFGWMTKV